MTDRNDMMTFIRETMGLDASLPGRLEPLAAGGSDRTFYRFTSPDGPSVILIDYDPARTENTCYADIAVFLKSMHISVPSMIGHDPARHLMIMEDIGDEDLHAFGGH